MFRYIFKLALILLPIIGNSQLIDGKTYTPFNNFYKWRGGAFDTTLLIPQVASPNGKRPGSIYYNTSDSSVYSWSGSQWRRVSGDTTSLSNRINLKINISDTATMLNNYKFTAANGLTKDNTVFRLGGSLNQNTNINLSARRFDISSGSDTTRFFANGSLSLGATPSDSTYRFNVNGGAKMDSLIVDSLYAKFGRTLASGIPVAPIEFRIASSKTRIDLRPAGAGGWNNNWYGAITHTSSETDILSSPYGSLYLGAINYFGSSGIYLGNTRNNPSMYIRNNNNILVGDTANTGFRFDVNGRARVRDTLTLSTTPVTSDTTANDLLVINSSNGQVRRYTGAWPVPMPTLQQVTTAGNTTTDSLNIRTSDGKFAVGIYGINFTAGEKSGEIRLRNTFDSTYSVVNVLGFSRFHYPTGPAKEVTFQNIRNQYSQISFPDSSGTLTQRVAINGTTYNTAANGVIDMNGLWINASATLDFPSTNNGNESDLTITVTGASEGDVVSLGIPNSVNLNHSFFTAWVSASDTVTVRFNNYGTGALNPASATFKVKVFK